MQKITKCVIPAAGFGTRFLPATKALPKEMFPIIDKPVMQYLVEEAVEAGITDIMIVTGWNKRAIEDHFDSNFELETRLESKGKNRELEEIKKCTNLANIYYARQNNPRGDGDAIMKAKTFVGDEPFLVLFGDDIIDNEVSAAKQLITAYEEKTSSIIATIKVSDSEVSSYGIIESKNISGNLHLADRVIEKPLIEDTKSRIGVIGKYVVTNDIFNYLEEVYKNKKDDEEIRLSDAFDLMIKNREVYGLEIEGNRYDAGSKLGFLKASVAFALNRNDLKDDFRKFLKDII